MSCYIIGCEVKEEASRDSLKEAIKEYSRWARITDNTWAVVTAKTAVEIRNDLREISGIDRLFVVKSGVEAAWFNSLCSNKWLQENL